MRRSFPIFKLKTMREIEDATRFIPVPDAPHVLFYSLFDGDYIWYLAFNASKNDVKLPLPCAKAEHSAQAKKADIFVDADKASSSPLYQEEVSDGVFFVERLSAKVIRIKKKRCG